MGKAVKDMSRKFAEDNSEIKKKCSASLISLEMPIKTGCLPLSSWQGLINLCSWQWADPWQHCGEGTPR